MKQRKWHKAASLAAHGLPIADSIGRQLRYEGDSAIRLS